MVADGIIQLRSEQLLKMEEQLDAWLDEHVWYLLKAEDLPTFGCSTSPQAQASSSRERWWLMLLAPLCSLLQR